MKSKEKILIVEDELLIAEHLSMCLEDEGFEVVDIVPSYQEAIEVLRQKTVQLVLLDINLEDELDGIDLAHEIRNSFKIPFIFITSNTDKRTISRAKITRPAGFIVKPFQPEDLKPSIEIALYSNQHKVSPPARTEDSSFFLKDKDGMKRVFYHDIQFAEAADNYTILHTSEKRFMLSKTLKSVEAKLKPYGFLRIHRSYLVNVARIDCVRPTEVIIDNKVLSTSSAARSELMKFIKTF